MRFVARGDEYGWPMRSAGGCQGASWLGEGDGAMPMGSMSVPSSDRNRQGSSCGFFSSSPVLADVQWGGVCSQYDCPWSALYVFSSL